MNEIVFIYSKITMNHNKYTLRIHYKLTFFFISFFLFYDIIFNYLNN